MSNPNYRVEVPTNPKELIDLAVRVYQRHTELGPDSPLNALASHTWIDNGLKVGEALALQKQAEDLKHQSEEAINKRNVLIPDLENSVKASRDLLMGVYRETPRTLSQFGFNIFESGHSAAKKAEK